MSANNNALVMFKGIRFVGLIRYELLEALYFTKDQLVVARTDKSRDTKIVNFSAEQTLSADKNNFAITYSDVERVQLKKSLNTIQVGIHAGGKKYQWNLWYMLGNEFLVFDDVKRVLLQIFGWKLEAPDEF
jgi:hypothetical protein